MGKQEAPGGASFSAGRGEPAIHVLKRQGSDEKIDASITRINRMLRTVFDNEKQIRAWEDMKASDGKRYVMGENGKLKWVPVAELVGDSLDKARRQQKEHIEELIKVLDYGATTKAYRDVPCPDCRLPVDPIAFIDRVADFEKPAIQCKTCSGRGAVREKKKGKRAKAYLDRIQYVQRTLDDVINIAKVRMGTTGASDAYLDLEAKNRKLLLKFGSERQTPLEGADAEQAVRQGIVDAALRFDPTRKEMASFGTVAYKWCFRNSRARHEGQKRHGIYAPSLDGISRGVGEDRLFLKDIVTDQEGTFGVVGRPTKSAENTLTLDVREHVERLPEDQRSVIQYELAGMETGEISEKTGFTKVKVRRLRKAAFAALREPLAGYVSALSE